MSDISRRRMFLKLGILFNGMVGVLLAVPIVRYLLSPVARERKPGYESWISLGSVDQFPSGQTRLATYRNPIANSSDGETANIPCWVRNVDGKKFQVFAINCAHLGCPVRWFPQSGLFEYSYKVEQGKLLIRAGALPTPGSPVPSLTNISIRRSPCA